MKLSEIAATININIFDSKKKTSIFGILGQSPLGAIISIPDQVTFDYLHLVLQGHAKWIYEKMFFDKNLENIYQGLIYLMIKITLRIQINLCNFFFQEIN